MKLLEEEAPRKYIGAEGAHGDNDLGDDGGPVLPLREKWLDDPNSAFEGVTRWEMGISLRDLFAGLAMHGMLAGPECANKASSVADDAYLIADAMLERK